MDINDDSFSLHVVLTLILLTWRIWWAPTTASRWQIEFNLAFKGLKTETSLYVYVDWNDTDSNQYMDHIQNIPPFKGTYFL
jgi:hypothetical protein